MEPVILDSSVGVSAIVVTYNGMQWIDRCLDSLASSEHPVKVIVIDNGSTDGTQEHIRNSYPDVLFEQADRNLGFGQANNRGIELAMNSGSDHVFLLNQDAWIKPTTILGLVKAHQAHTHFGILSPMHLNGAGDALDRMFSIHIGPANCPGLFSDLFMGKVKDAPYTTSNANAAAWLLSKACIERVGGFSPAFFHYGEDDNYLQRVRYHGLDVGVVPTEVIHHDREQREPGTYHTDPLELAKRKMILYYSDPNCTLSPKEEIRALRLAIIRAVLTMDRGSFARSKARLKALRSFDEKAIEIHRETSKSVGPSFLSILK